VAAAPALAQDEVPACELHDACLDTSEEQKANANQYTESPEPIQAFPVNPASDMECEGDSTKPCSPNQEVTQSDNARYAAVPEAAFDAPASCSSCGLQVAQGALDAITEDRSGVTDSADAFGAALQAARVVAYILRTQSWEFLPTDLMGFVVLPHRKREELSPRYVRVRGVPDQAPGIHDWRRNTLCRIER
jgi:hypothetical protein